MGLFKSLFGKKPGGSIVGNLLRGAANKATGGILGNGVALAARNQREQQKAYEQSLKDTSANQSYQFGQQFGQAAIQQSGLKIPQFDQYGNQMPVQKKGGVNVDLNLRQSFWEKNGLWLAGIVGFCAITITLILTLVKKK